jgi:uncharacterized protein (TIGR00159 family)
MWTLFRWQNIIDYCTVTIFLYVLLHLAREARALRTAVFIVALYAGALVARNFDLLITSWVLEACAFIGVAVLLLTFQSELRYVLLQLNTMFRLLPQQMGAPAQTGRAIADASVHLASSRTGALIIILGQETMAGIVTGGVPVGAAVSAQLLEAIFQKTSPLHDGAVLIAGDRLIEASAILPLTERQDVPLVYGTRHRAGLGLSERTDALVIVVSEERGEVTLMQQGNARLIERAEQLAQLLQTGQRRPKRRLHRRIATLVLADAKLKLMAAGVAALVWGTSLVATGSTIRIVSVPVEFSDVPRGYNLAEQSAPRITLQLRGSSWLMNTDSLSRLIVHFSLRSSPEGRQHFRIGGRNVNLPPGIVLDAASPPDLWVALVKNGTATGPASRGTAGDTLPPGRSP